MDQEHVADLYRAHVPQLRRLAFLMLGGDRDRAEDIVHDVFIRAVGRLSLLRDPDRFEAYLRRSVANAVVSSGRRRLVERRWLERHAVSTVSMERHDPTAGVDSALEVAALLGQLPTRQRLAVAARVCLDLSEAQTAQLLGCSPGTVKSLTSRGLAKLREQATSDGTTIEVEEVS